MANPFARDAGEPAGAGLLATLPPGDNAAPMSVSELSSLLKRTVEDRFGHVRLRGELSGTKRAASGHLYFCLKDENAIIDAVMWKGAAQRLAFRPEDGLEVVATGRLTTYPGRSKYQIVAESLELAGEGALMALFERLRVRLAAEGLFSRPKRTLPFLPRTIGIVTSPTGAVVRDILHRLADRCPCHVLVWPVLVQGADAAGQVAAAVNGFSAMPAGGPVPRPDLVIVARGGGSIEDLWAFNEEVVVRAVAASTIPVISAVGHETDTTLCDHAADLRAPTPTAAAELAVPVRAELLAMLADSEARQLRAIRRTLDLARERLAASARLLPRRELLLQARAQRLDDAGERLRRALGLRLSEARGDVARAGGALRPALLAGLHARSRDRLAAVRLDPALVTRRIGDGRSRLAAAARMAAQLHPDAVLARGYARVIDAAGATVSRRDQAARHARLTLRFQDGSIDVATGAPTRRERTGGTAPDQPSLL